GEQLQVNRRQGPQGKRQGGAVEIQERQIRRCHNPGRQQSLEIPIRRACQCFSSQENRWPSPAVSVPWLSDPHDLQGIPTPDYLGYRMTQDFKTKMLYEHL